MKQHKIRIAALALGAVLLGVRADPVTDGALALAVANNWISENSAFGAKGSATNAVAEKDADGNILWWTVTTDAGAALFVSGDDEIEPVLAALPHSDGVLAANHPLRAMLTRDIKIRKMRLSLASSSATSSSSRGMPVGTQVGAGAKLAANTSSLTKAQQRWAKLSGNDTQKFYATGYHTTNLVESTIRLVDGFSEIVTCTNFVYDTQEGEGGTVITNSITTNIYNNVVSGPLSHWNQEGGIYNYYMNLYFGEEFGYPCGCVATAASSVMQFFRVKGPIYAVQNKVSYAVSETKVNSTNLTMVGHVDRNPYDWSVVPKFMGGDADGIYYVRKESTLTNPSEEESLEYESAKDSSMTDTGKTSALGEKFYVGTPEVESLTADPGAEYTVVEYVEAYKEMLGRVALDAGIGVNMTYAPDGSSASSAKIAPALTDYYGFSSAKYVSLTAEGDPAGYTNNIYNEVSSGYPVIMAIAQEGAETGHAVVAVGYGEEEDGTSWTRVFLGWGGISDGWYALPDIACGLDPTGQVTEEAYNLVNSVITSIRYRSVTGDDAFAYSPTEARDKALADGKPILLVSADETDTSGMYEAVLQYIADNNLTAIFSIYFASTYYDAFGAGDTKFSFGVYNPYYYDTSQKWSQYGNGLLSYCNLSNYETFSPAMTNEISEVLGTGLQAYNAYVTEQESDIRLTIHGTRPEILVTETPLGDIVSWTEGTFEDFEVSPAYGEHVEEYQSERQYELVAPPAVTNGGVVWACTGWSLTNYTTGASVTNIGNKVKITFKNHDDIGFTWQWGEYAYHITTAVSGDAKANIAPVTDIWVTNGTELTLQATGVKKKFQKWEIKRQVSDYDLLSYQPQYAEALGYVTNAWTSINDCCITVTVAQAMQIGANFRDYGADEPPEVEPAMPTPAPELVEVLNFYPDYVPATPTAIAFYSIVKVEGSEQFVLTITDAVAKCWYRLISSTNLETGFETTNDWLQATETGAYEFPTQDVKGVQTFWRAEGKGEDE